MTGGANPEPRCCVYTPPQSSSRAHRAHTQRTTRPNRRVPFAERSARRTAGALKREHILFVLRESARIGKNIVVVHEPDERFGRFDFARELNDAPDDIKALRLNPQPAPPACARSRALALVCASARHDPTATPRAPAPPQGLFAGVDSIAYRRHGLEQRQMVLEILERATIGWGGRRGRVPTRATSAPGLGSPLSHLHRDWAHASHIISAPPCPLCLGTEHVVLVQESRRG